MAYGSFSANITRWTEKTGIKLDRVVRKIGFEALTGLIQMSPVDTGRFRASWRIGIGAVDLSAHPEIIKSPGLVAVPAAVSLGLGTAALDGAKWGVKLFISNNVPYAGELERGKSRQAPQGMLFVTFHRIRLGLDALVRNA